VDILNGLDRLVGGNPADKRQALFTGDLTELRFGGQAYAAVLVLLR
jgi:hypothetical protein